MENERFDAISRLLGGGASRRKVLATLAGAAGLGLSKAAAKRRHGGKTRGKAKGRVKSDAVESNGTIVVTPGAMDGWVEVLDDGHPAGGVEFVTGPETPPLGAGSVQLSTPDGKKAALANPDYADLAIADIDSLSYSTYMQNGSNTGVVVPAIKLPVLYDNGTKFTTLIFEPTYSENSDVVANEWQSWDALSADARWWSSKALPNGICAFDCFVSWSAILDAIPDAKITGGLLLETGSGTPNAVGNVDALEINGTTYDFEPSVGPPADKNACKDGGWKTFDTPRQFKNQGDCIQFVNTGK